MERRVRDHGSVVKFAKADNLLATIFSERFFGAAGKIMV